MARNTALRRSLERSPSSIAANCSSSSVRSSEHSSKYVALKSSRSLMAVRSYPSGLVQDAVDDVDQLFRIERLDDPAGAAGGAALIALVLAGFGGEDQDRQALVLARGAHALDELDAVHHRHVDVG